MKIHYSLLIKAPIETVFAFVEVEDSTKKWNPILEEVTNPDGFNPKHPVGTKFVQAVREPKAVQHLIGKVTAYNKPHLLGLTLTHYDYTARMTYRLTRENKGTLVDLESDLTSTNWFHSLFLPVMQFFNKRQIIRQMYQLRIAAEKKVKKS